MPAPLPERIGRYRVQARLGRGAMGIVYAAIDEEVGHEVAIKIMMADLEGEPETRARFLREAQAAGCLVHPNIISIFDIGEEEGRVYLVMERLRGQTLQDYLVRPQGTTLDEKLSVMMQVCDGLAVAHARGIFHRDIKPGNLFVEEDGRVKILDFGVARLASSTMTASGYIIGTPDYMSPEQARGREVDQRSDIFSAGAVFYYMLTGRKPFAAKDLPTVLRKVQSEAPPPLTEIEAPAPLDQIIDRALAKEPASRYQTMGEMLADLAAVREARERDQQRLAARHEDEAREVEALRAERDRLRAGFGLAALPGVDPVAGGEAAARPVHDESARARLKAEVERFRAARTALETAERALSAGRPDQALAPLEQAARALPELPRAREALDRCRAALAERRARDVRVESLVAEARGAASRGHWTEADELAAQALALDPNSSAAGAARREAAAAAAEEARQRAERFTAAEGLAGEAIAAGRLEDAAEAIERARQADPERTEAIGELESRLAAAREVRAASDARLRLVADAITRAHHVFEAGRRAEAIASLGEILASDPEAPGLAEEIDRLRAEADRLAETERRHEAARAELGRARDALDREDFAGAVAFAERALKFEDRLPEARRLMALAEVRQRERANALARSARSAEFVTRARRLVKTGSFARALREVGRALAIDPANAEARAVEVEVQRLEAEARVREAEAKQRRERARQADAFVKRARGAARAGRPEEARSLLAQALAIDERHADALSLSHRLAREAAAREEDEDTVVQSADADPDDTVALAPQAPPQPGRVRPWGVLIDRFRRPRGRTPYGR